MPKTTCSLSAAITAPRAVDRVLLDRTPDAGPRDAASLGDARPAPTPDRLKSLLLEQFGRWCTLCGDRRAHLKLDRINRARPASVVNCLLACEECRPALFAPKEIDGDLRRPRRRNT